MGTLHIIKPDGTTETRPADRMPPFADLRKIVDGHIEFIWVSFNGKRTCMIVNETGAIADGNRGPLQVNDKATAIYHAWGQSQGRAMIDAPKVHGTVVVLEDIRVE